MREIIVPIGKKEIDAKVEISHSVLISNVAVTIKSKCIAWQSQI